MSGNWEIFGLSIRGAIHKRNKIPNQDAISWQKAQNHSSPFLLTVSDGHGGTIYFRSHIGARYAVIAAKQILYNFLERNSSIVDIAQIQNFIQTEFPPKIIKAWREMVADHLFCNPFHKKEQVRLLKKENTKAVHDLILDPVRAYGATLIGVGVTTNYIIYFQLGDGDILNVSSKGDVSRPIPRDKSLLANETSSLCECNAHRNLRFAIHNNEKDNPVLILVSTDGYSNSFVNDSDFLKIGTDLYNMLSENGDSPIKDELKAWLEETSNAGSGDDITVGLIYRSEILNAVKNPCNSIKD